MSDDPWLTEISRADIEAAIQRKAAREALITEQAAEITRLRAACDASKERERAIELRFWQTVDRDGLTGLPSDMWAALEQLVQNRAAAIRVAAKEDCQP